MSIESATLTPPTPVPGGPGGAVRLPLRSRVARTLLREVARRVPVDVVLPDGTDLASGRPHVPGDRPALVVHRPEELYRRIGENPKVGVGESFTAGDWDAAPGHDLADVLAPFATHLPRVLPGWLMRMRRLVDRAIPADQRGALAHTRANVAAHYDLSNEMFAGFLDETMSYSSALFDPTRPVAEQPLAEAQLRKVSAVLDAAEVGPGTELLEIGTGWGTLAIEAARRGAEVLTVTLSVEQADLARARVEAAGVGHLVEVRVCDYRDVVGRFDAVVSVEMIEAVGERYWPDYFRALSELVRPGGEVVLQAIVMSHERYLATRHSWGWIQKHIFPGGLIPSLRAVDEQATAAGLQVVDTHLFGADYAETLRRWRESFVASWGRVRGFDEEFARTWQFYLAYSEAGFATGYLDVAHLRLDRAAR